MPKKNNKKNCGGGAYLTGDARVDAARGKTNYLRVIELGRALEDDGADFPLAERVLARLVADGTDLPTLPHVLGMNCFHGVCVHGSLRGLQWLLTRLPAAGLSADQCKAGACLRSDDGTTPLHAAAGNGHLDLVQLLCEAGCHEDLTAETDDGRSPLYSAVVAGRADVVAWVVSQQEYALNRPLAFGPPPQLPGAFTPASFDVFFVACAEGYLAVARLLLPAVPPDHLTRPQANGATPLEIACQLGRLPVVRWLLEEVGVPRTPYLRIVAQNCVAEKREEMLQYLESPSAPPVTTKRTEALLIDGALQGGIGNNCCWCATCRHGNLIHGKKLLACSQCKKARYCDQQCQREDWKAHKKVCKELQAAAATRDATDSASVQTVSI